MTTVKTFDAESATALREELRQIADAINSLDGAFRRLALHLTDLEGAFEVGEGAFEVGEDALRDIPNFAPEHKRSFARSGKYEVRLAGGLACPHCARFLHASNVTTDCGDFSLICGGCHKDALNITSAP